MRIERKLSKVSLYETLLYFGLMFILINGTVFLFTFVKGNPRLLLYGSSWLIQFVFPLTLAILQNYINRNGILKLTEFDNPKTLLEKVELPINRSFKKVVKGSGDFKYLKKTKLARFFNFFFREDVQIKATDDKIMVYAKRGLLDSIEMKVRFGKNN